jgi:hypothetical protein
METVSLNPKVDAYFGKARPFAQPILWHLRGLIHKGCPGVDETIKWSRPFFEYKGKILCNISAFNEHCSFGFWGEKSAQSYAKPRSFRMVGWARSDASPPSKIFPPTNRCSASFDRPKAS